MSGCWVLKKNYVPWNMLYFTSTEFKYKVLATCIQPGRVSTTLMLVSFNYSLLGQQFFGRSILNLELDSSAFYEVNLYGIWFVHYMQFLHRLVLTVKKLFRNCSKPVIYLLPFSLLQLVCGVGIIWADQSQPFCYLLRSSNLFYLTV
jgi:hypothetical protein